jgi:hypothetical protein
MCRSSNGHSLMFKGLFALALVAAVALGAGRSAMADPDANTCNGTSELSYPTATNYTQCRRTRCTS